MHPNKALVFSTHTMNVVRTNSIWSDMHADLGKHPGRAGETETSAVPRERSCRFPLTAPYTGGVWLQNGGRIWTPLIPRPLPMAGQLWHPMASEDRAMRLLVVQSWPTDPYLIRTIDTVGGGCYAECHILGGRLASGRGEGLGRPCREVSPAGWTF